MAENERQEAEGHPTARGPIPDVPAPDGDEVVEIHKPKAAHSWREFAIEIGTIICGILIALGLEQTIEWVHWNHQVDEARHAIRAELAHDLGALEYRAAESACVKRRIDELAAWEQSWKIGKPLQPTGALAGPTSWGYYVETWSVAQAGQVAAHFPLEELNQYAQLYGQVRAVDKFQSSERDDWLQLVDFEGAGTLDQHDLMRLHGIRSRLARWNSSVALNLRLMKKRADALGIEAEHLEPINPAGRAAFCGPLFADKTPAR